MKNEETATQANETEQTEARSGEEVLAQLRARLQQIGHPTLKQEYGSPRRGLETGLDDAFIVDTETRNALIEDDPYSSMLFKPFVPTADIIRWAVEQQTSWLINTVPGMVDIDDYPAIKKYLQRFREQLEKRGSSQQWYELSQPGELDAENPGEMKIVYQQRSSWPGFTIDKLGVYHASSAFTLPKGDYFLTGLLNSKLYWFMLQGMSPRNQEGFIELLPEHLESLPIPRKIDVDHVFMVGQYSNYCHSTATERGSLHAHICQEIANHLAPDMQIDELSPVLRRWYALDMKAFCAEAERHFGKPVPQEQLAAWENFFENGKTQFNIVNTGIAQAERKLDLEVYRIFGLTEEEIEWLDKF